MQNKAKKHAAGERCGVNPLDPCFSDFFDPKTDNNVTAPSTNGSAGRLDSTGSVEKAGTCAPALLQFHRIRAPKSAPKGGSVKVKTPDGQKVAVIFLENVTKGNMLKFQLFRENGETHTQHLIGSDITSRVEANDQCVQDSPVGNVAAVSSDSHDMTTFRSIEHAHDGGNGTPRPEVCLSLSPAEILEIEKETQPMLHFPQESSGAITNILSQAPPLDIAFFPRDWSPPPTSPEIASLAGVGQVRWRNWIEEESDTDGEGDRQTLDDMLLDQTTDGMIEEGGEDNVSHDLQRPLDTAERAGLGSCNFASAPGGACSSHDEKDDDSMGEGDNDWVQAGSARVETAAQHDRQRPQQNDGFGRTFSVQPTGIQNQGGTCFLSALLQVLIRTEGFVRCCTMGSKLGALVLKIIEDMREANGSAVQSKDLETWLRSEPDFQQAYLHTPGSGDPQALCVNICNHLVQANDEGGVQIATEFGITEQYVATCRTCKAEQVTPSQLKPMLQIVQVSRNLQSTVDRLFTPCRNRQHCMRCDRTTTHDTARTPFPPPAHLIMFVEKDAHKKMPVRIGDHFHLAQNGQPKYNIAGTVQALPAHFVANFQHEGQSYLADDDSVVKNGETHAAYIIVSHRVPNRDAHDTQMALQLPCVTCDVPGCNNILRRNWVEVKPCGWSQEQGLFALTDIPAFTFVATFGAATTTTLPESGNYVIRIRETGTGTELYVRPVEEDGVDNSQGGGARANHCCCPHHQNATLMHNGGEDGQVEIWVQTCKHVVAADEIFVNYGPNFSFQCKCCYCSGQCK